jgi:hypothetical protein
MTSSCFTPKAEEKSERTSEKHQHQALGEHFAAAAVLFRKLLFKIDRERLHGDLRLLEIHSRLKPRDHARHPESAVIEPLLLHAGEHLVAHGDGNPQVGAPQVADVAQFARRNSDHREVLLVQLNRPPENPRVGAELRIP